MTSQNRKQMIYWFTLYPGIYIYPCRYSLWHNRVTPRRVIIFCDQGHFPSHFATKPLIDNAEYQYIYIICVMMDWLKSRCQQIDSIYKMPRTFRLNHQEIDLLLSLNVQYVAIFRSSLPWKQSSWYWSNQGTVRDTLISVSAYKCIGLRS